MNKISGKSSHFYTAYGLNIKSDIRLDDLVAARSGENINISLRNLNASFLKTELKDAEVFNRPGCVVRVSKNAFCYDWKDLGTALIRNGNEVLIDPQPGVENEEFGPFITGAILAILLNQRGKLILHASAVVINGEAVAFLGEKGAGKSTLAAHLQKRGYNFITDDLVPIIFADEKVQTEPGFPRIKLNADSAKSMDLDWESLPQVHKFIDKRSYQKFNNFSTNPVTLGRIYVLEKDPNIEIKKLELAQSFIEITKHTYLGRYLQTTGQTASHFEKCKQLISVVPVFSLKRPHNHNRLAEIISEIEKYS